jgi:DNA-binding NarL/FixJ family response regulator
LLKSSIRVLIVEDFGQWRRFYCSTLQQQSKFRVIGEVSDGLEAVHRAGQLQPDLILLDIGLPTLNGIEAARRIGEISAASKILFVSENRSAEIVREALSTGAGGYVVKSDAAGELLPAINLVLEGERFVSASLADSGLDGPPNHHTAGHPDSDNVVTFTQPQNIGIARHHEVGFYSEDRHFLDHVSGFVVAALKAGNAVIVVATESHRESLLSQFQSEGLDMAAAMEEGRYIPLDAADTLSTFMVTGLLDPLRFLKVAGDLIVEAANAVNGDSARVTACGECAPLLWAQGNVEAAIQLEHLWDEIARAQKVDILCGYSLGIGSGMDSHTFERICAEHSAVHSL